MAISLAISAAGLALSVGIAWGFLRATVSGIEKRIEKIESRLDDHDTALQAVIRMEEQLRSMRAELHNVADFLNRIRNAALRTA